MAQRLRIKWNRSAVRSMLRSVDVQYELDQIADGMAMEAGHGYESGDHQWSTRGRASVITESLGAMQDNARNHTLLRVLAGKSRTPMTEYVTYTRKDGTTRRATRKQAEQWMKQRGGA